MNDERVWQAKVAARLHDPPEKALVLLRTPEGHEGGTVHTLLGEFFPQGVPPEINDIVRRADHWAAAADRAAFPKHEKDGRYPAWQRVDFMKKPVFIHPLTAQGHRLDSLAVDLVPDHAQALGTDHQRKLIQRDGRGKPDYRHSALALWRFVPELEGSLHNLWRLLPADSRVPDHTIHDHLDLTSAFTGAFAADPKQEVSLLGVAIGPVQDFIAAARSTSDLWAGSHLLSRLAWEAIRVVCETCGPDAVLFPRLRGVPQVDVWLVRDCGLNPALFDHCEWRQRKTDANPLFIAALPNRFTAVVPTALVADLAQRIEEAVRGYARDKAQEAFRRLLLEAGIDDRPDLYGYQQIERQLRGFPEVYWAAVPWSLACDEKEKDSHGEPVASDDKLARAMRPFFVGDDKPGWLGSQAWGILSGGLTLEEGWFYRPNPGALYPALHELLERSLAAVKATRQFAAMNESGWRCSLTGEYEWITTDPAQLQTSYRQRDGTLWTRVAQKRPAWVKPGEHLSALSMLKRLWPTLYAEEVSDVTMGATGGLKRFVVSTHTLALASAIERAIDQGKRPDPDITRGERVALPRRLERKLRETGEDESSESSWRRVPGWLESQIDGDGENRAEEARRRLAKILGTKPDTYYGLLLMDGDDMGAWLSAGSGKAPLASKSFHPDIRERLKARFGSDPNFLAYAQEPRAPNPAWHMAVSEALNNFELRLVPEIVESHHLGWVIYAGGDDVLAMLAASDLLEAAEALRHAYSGQGGVDESTRTEGAARLNRLANGWAQLRGRERSRNEVLRLMGEGATASAGLVIAHHQAPLGAVLRELRATEQRAKRLAGKNAWSLAVLKRGGGALYVTAPWGKPLRLFHELRWLLASDGVSRRAAYHLTEWMSDVPDSGDHRDLVATLLAYQMQRQCVTEKAKDTVREIVPRLVEAAYNDENRLANVTPLRWLENMLLTAEFLAREQRHSRPVATTARGT